MKRMNVIVAMGFVILLCLACSPVIANESGVVNGSAGSDNITRVISAKVISCPPGTPACTTPAEIGSTVGSESYVFVTKWGTKGGGNGQFRYPRGIAVDSSGNVYVADTGNHRIQKFTSTGTYIKDWQASESPEGIATDSSGNVYVTDPIEHTIVRYKSDGTLSYKWNKNGRLSGIAADSEGNVYFSNGDKVGNLKSYTLFLIPRDLRGYHYITPSGVAADSNGNVYVMVDSGHGYCWIVKFSSDGISHGQWGTQDELDWQFWRSSQIAVDSDGNVYVVDSYNTRILKFTSTGTYITQWGSYGSEDGQFIPEGIAVDSSGNVYVSDTGNDRIQKFKKV